MTGIAQVMLAAGASKGKAWTAVGWDTASDMYSQASSKTVSLFRVPVAGELIVVIAGGQKFAPADAPTVSDNIGDGVSWTAGQTTRLSINSGIDELVNTHFWKRVGTPSGSNRSVTVSSAGNAVTTVRARLYTRADLGASITREINAVAKSDAPVSAVNLPDYATTLENLQLETVVVPVGRNVVIAAGQGWAEIADQQANPGANLRFFAFERIGSGSVTVNGDCSFTLGDGLSSYAAMAMGWRVPT